MDILSHTFSGMAIGTVAMQFCKGGFREKATVLFFSTLGGFIPDLDAISYWSVNNKPVIIGKELPSQSASLGSR